MTIQQEQQPPVESAREQARGFSACALVQAMRPRQWTKNGFVLLAIIFGQRLLDRHAVVETLGAFLIFCLLSSSVYLINDVADVEKDRQHPTKCLRPIARGALSLPAAWGCAVLLAALSLGASLWLPRAFSGLALGYFALNLAYSFRLKHVVILDVLCIAIFFVLRAAAGAAAIPVTISHWLLICTVLLALFIALSKRRHELVLLTGNASGHRESLSEYSPYLLDQMIAVVTASTLMAYVLYTVDERTVNAFGSDRLVYTVPFVLFGIFRYLYLVHQKGQGGDPDRIIYADKQFLGNVVLWALAVGLLIYLR